MRITTWNVNSIRKRIDAVLRWLESARPDILCLQETKCTEDKFPWVGFASLGYTVSVVGQPTYNGVAILSRSPQKYLNSNPVRVNFSEARALSATTMGVRILNVYVPYGEAVGSSKFKRKLLWLDRLRDVLVNEEEPPAIVCGDFNVAPEDRDVYDPRTRKDKLICTAPERDRFNKLLLNGVYVDALRSITDEGGHYTWWSHRAGAVAGNRGLRVDHHLVHTSLAGGIQSVGIDVDERKRQGASDHAPVTLVLKTNT